MTAPTYRSAGTISQGSSTSNLTSGTPGLPAGWAQDDIFILWVSTRASSLTLPGGWAAIPGTVPQWPTSGTYSRFYWKRAGSSESAPTVTSSASNIYQMRVYAFSGAITTGTPVESIVYTAVESSGTSIVFPAVTTSGADELIFLHVYGGSPGTSVSTPTNGNLTGITEREDLDAANGFDHWASTTGAKATAASTGTSAATWASATTWIATTVAIKSNSLQTIVGSDVTSATVDTAIVNATIVAADTGAGVDSGVQTTTALVNDPATGTDTASIRFGDGDTGSFVESVKVVANGATLGFGTDAGAATEAATIRVLDSDIVSTQEVAYVGYQGALPSGPRVVRVMATTNIVDEV